MAESTVVRTKRDGQIAIVDSGGTHSYTVAYEVGDFSFDCPAEAVNLFLDRGRIGANPSVRYGDDQPMTFSFSAHLRDIGDTAHAYATLMDICNRPTAGTTATTWTSTLGTASDVFTLTVTLTIEGSDFGEVDKTLTFPYCSLRASVSEGDPDTINVTGTSYAARYTLA